MKAEKIIKLIEDTITYDSFGLHGVDEASHAIAERLAEDVVWEGVGIIRESAMIYPDEPQVGTKKRWQVAVESTRAMHFSHWARPSLSEMRGEPVTVQVVRRERK
jgi:hypothetical protein